MLVGVIDEKHIKNTDDLDPEPPRHHIKKYICVSEQVKKFRDRGFLALKKICLIQLGLASISVITGIVAVSFAAKNPQFPYIIAAPVWSGVLVRRC